MDGIDTKPQQGQTQSHAQQNGQPNLKDSKKSKGKKKPNNNSKKPTIGVSNHTNIKDENGLIESVQQMTILDGLNYDQPMANGKHANGSDTDDITNHVDAVSQPQQQHSIENGDALPNEDAITTQCDDLSNGTTVSDTLTTIEGYPVLPSTSEYIDDDQSSLTVNTDIPIETVAPLERIVDAAALAALEPPSDSDVQIVYKQYESEVQMPDIIRLIQKDLSEPYSIYTYRYFIHNWPSFCFLAMHDNVYVGAIVCKLDTHRYVKRGYIAMLAVDKEYRKLKIGTNLVHKAIQAMLDNNAEEVVLETEITNTPALRLYENLGFIRDKRLFHYYLNGVDALRLKLWFR